MQSTVAYMWPILFLANLCAGVSVSLCNYTAEALVGDKASMPRCVYFKHQWLKLSGSCGAGATKHYYNYCNAEKRDDVRGDGEYDHLTDPKPNPAGSGFNTLVGKASDRNVEMIFGFGLRLGTLAGVCTSLYTLHMLIIREKHWAWTQNTENCGQSHTARGGGVSCTFQAGGMGETVCATSTYRYISQEAVVRLQCRLQHRLHSYRHTYSDGLKQKYNRVSCFSTSSLLPKK